MHIGVHPALFFLEGAEGIELAALVLDRALEALEIPVGQAGLRKIGEVVQPVSIRIFVESAQVLIHNFVQSLLDFPAHGLELHAHVVLGLPVQAVGPRDLRGLEVEIRFYWQIDRGVIVQTQRLVVHLLRLEDVLKIVEVDSSREPLGSALLLGRFAVQGILGNLETARVGFNRFVPLAEQGLMDTLELTVRDHAVAQTVVVQLD